MSAVHTAASRAAEQTPTILIMEDETNVAKGLKLILDEEGYQVDWADSGARALELFQQKQYDLLLADLRLPDIDGIEVIKEVKHQKPRTGVIVITGYSTVNSAVEAMKLGASDYLQKPFTDDEIRTAIHEALAIEATFRPAPQVAVPVVNETALLLQKREVFRVLNRTADDKSFWQDLMDMRLEALDHYKLSPEARTAILTGDLRWINDNVGELTQKQLRFIFQRQQNEVLVH
ncbi:MAG: response regulator [Deltaproteobacteria bacterium]|nr:response regulator [Deltaproteobacteria bacterium]